MQCDTGSLFDTEDEYIANEMAVRLSPAIVIYATADGRLQSTPYVGKEGRKIGKGPFGPRIGSQPPSLDRTVAHLEKTIGLRGRDWEMLHDGAQDQPDGGLDGLVARFREFQAAVAPGARPR